MTGSGAPALLIVLSGPSGVGKDTVIRRIREAGRPFHFVVTATTRPPREGERDGVDYHFLSQEQFDDLLANEGLLEHARVYGRSYGVPRQNVIEALARGEDVIMRVDVQGARTIRQLVPDAVLIFLAPASVEELRRRLTERSSETPESLRTRLDLVEQEMEQIPLFDYVVVNEDGHLDRTVEAIDAIVAAEHARTDARRVTITDGGPDGER